MVLALNADQVLSSRKLLAKAAKRPAKPAASCRRLRRRIPKGRVQPHGVAAAQALPPQRLLLSLDVLEDCICLTRWGRGGSMDRRIISAQDAAMILSADLAPGAEGGAAIAGRLGAARRHELRGAGALCGWLDADRRQHYVIRTPAHARIIRVRLAGKWTRLRCRLPDLLAEVVGGVIDGRFVWQDIARVGAFFDRFTGGVGRMTPDADKIVYCPPLPNVDSDGDPCMGEVKLDRPEWAQLSPGELFEQAFLATDFADHYLSSSLVEGAVKKHKNIIAATRKAKGRVPKHWLKPLGSFGAVFLGQTPTPVERAALEQMDERQDDQAERIMREIEGQIGDEDQAALAAGEA